MLHSLFRSDSTRMAQLKLAWQLYEWKNFTWLFTKTGQGRKKMCLFCLNGSDIYASDRTFIRLSPIYFWQNNQSLVFLTLFLFRLVLLGLVPFSLLLFLNIRVFSAINNRKSSSRDRNYSTILLLVVIIFILCHFPRLVTLLSECSMLTHSTWVKYHFTFFAPGSSIFCIKQDLIYIYNTQLD